MPDDFRQRLAAALAATCKLHQINGGCIACDRRLAAIMAVRDEARESLRATVAHYENTITWGTTCHGCARILDSSIRETERAEKAEAEPARLKAEGARDA
jgi:ribosomal protein L34E